MAYVPYELEEARKSIAKWVEENHLTSQALHELTKIVDDLHERMEENHAEDLAGEDW